MVKITKIAIMISMLFLVAALALPGINMVKAVDLDDSDIEANPTSVYSLETSDITVTVDGTDGLIEGADVGIHVEGGTFEGGINIYNGTSDVNGEVTVEWTSPLVDHDIYYNFTTIIKKAASDNVTKTCQVLVQPVDFTGTTLEADPEDINEFESSDLTVTVRQGTTLIEGANVSMTGVGGLFTSTSKENCTGLSDVSGVYTNTWTAPDVADPTDYIIVLTVTYDGTNWTHTDEINITVNYVEGQIILGISILPDTDLYVGQTATIEITAIDNSTSLAVQNVFVVFNALDGNFTESGLDTHSGVTDSLGKITVHWETADLTPGLLGTDYNINITASQIGLLTNYTTLTFNVVEDSGTFDLTVSSSASGIDLGDVVEIYVTVTIDGVGEYNAFVEIIAQSGIFDESGTDEVTGYTNSSGIFVATWNTSEMVMVGSDPVDYTFDVTVDVFPYFLDEEDSIIITVDPGSTNTTPTGGPDGPFYTQWWFFAAAGGGVIIIGLIIIFARKKA
ncbi:MAG: hypothetical protein ACTSP7_07890 [Candidatus Heimdallarchaeota archaeon]